MGLTRLEILEPRLSSCAHRFRPGGPFQRSREGCRADLGLAGQCTEGFGFGNWCGVGVLLLWPATVGGEGQAGKWKNKFFIL